MNKRIKTILRMPEELFATVRSEIVSYAEKNLETFMFLWTSKFETERRVIFFAKSVILLDDHEVTRGAVKTQPTPEFCEKFYSTLKVAEVFRGSMRITAVHSHPFAAGSVGFSSIDLRSFESDRKAFAQSFGGVEFLGIVFNRDASAFEGIIVGSTYVQHIDEIQILGRTLTRLFHTNRSLK